MKLRSFVTAIIIVSLCTAFSVNAYGLAFPYQQQDQPPDGKPLDVSPNSSEQSSREQSTETSVEIKPLTEEEQSSLLSQRLDGGMGYNFRQFANMFFVSSRIHMGVGIGLMTSKRQIAIKDLQSPYPDSYHPTLREFLDTIALQTSSQWKYEPSGKFIQGGAGTKEVIDSIVIFEFEELKSKREKPFEITLANRWKAIDKGNWVMHVPPGFPVGMDIYDLGTFSTDEDEKVPGEFAKSVRLAVSMKWAQSFDPTTTEADLQPANVGEYEALYYEKLVDSELGKKIKWRQWVFMDGNQCYFVVSTILPELEEEIYPDVEMMVKSFRIKSK